MSPEVQTTEVATAPGMPVGKVCKECGEPTIPKGSSRKFCDRCKPALHAKPRSAPEAERRKEHSELSVLQ